MASSRESSFDSLFDEPTESAVVGVASLEIPPIPGLWVFPGLLPSEVAGEALQAMSDQDAFSGRDQVMLFTRPPPHPSSLPPYLLELQDSIITALIDIRIPPDELSIALDQTLARQVILNLYPPGQGISPHIDLPHRYADGIIGVSLTGGTVMSFEHEGKGLRYEVYLPERTIYVMTGEARWEWKHGIEGRRGDSIQGVNGLETRLRSARVSVTFRWMKEGADILA